MHLRPEPSAIASMRYQPTNSGRNETWPLRDKVSHVLLARITSNTLSPRSVDLFAQRPGRFGSGFNLHKQEGSHNNVFFDDQFEVR